LEALVFAARAAERIGPGLAGLRLREGVPAERTVGLGTAACDTTEQRNQLRHLMWDLVGIVRTDQRLQLAAESLLDLAAQVRELTVDAAPTPDLLELRNLIQAGALIVASSQTRRESRGLNFN